MSPRHQLLKMQRIILRQLKASVKRLQGNSPVQLTRYFQAYKKETQTYQKISSKAELIRAVKASDIVFGADFHPFAQSQRTHLRILRELIKGKRPVYLALEAIDSQHQLEINRYLAGETDDKKFLKNIDYFSSWGFPWENYKVLFEFAKSNHLRLSGLNQSKYDSKRSDLMRRDKHSAFEIARIKKSSPEAIVYVIYGDLHLASNHLPRLTRKYLGAAKDTTRFVTVFQNSESIYWRLAKRNLEEKVDVLKLRHDAYCVVNSPPWMKWQAYLQFLEGSLESDDSRGFSLETLDRTDYILGFAQIIKQIWRVKGTFNDFHIYNHGDANIISRVHKLVGKKYLPLVKQYVRLNRSFFISNPPLFYLCDFHVNHASDLVGQYIHSELRGEHKIYGVFPKDFIPLIWIEAIGFFASKIVNHRRRFSTIADLPSREQGKLLILEQRLREQVAYKTKHILRPFRKHKGYRNTDYFEAARVLGSLLGNKIYIAFQSEQVSIKTLQSWLFQEVGPSAEFLRFYSQVTTSLRPDSYSLKNKHERL